jgi:hypothetical protein
MELLILALIFFLVVGLSSKLGGETGAKVASGCLIVGSLILIASLPVACYVFLHFILPLL